MNRAMECNGDGVAEEGRCCYYEVPGAGHLLISNGGVGCADAILVSDGPAHL